MGIGGLLGGKASEEQGVGSRVIGGVMEVIRHAELIVEWFLWTIEHTNRSFDNSMQHFSHHGLCQVYNVMH